MPLGRLPLLALLLLQSLAYLPEQARDDVQLLVRRGWLVRLREGLHSSTGLEVQPCESRMRAELHGRVPELVRELVEARVIVLGHGLMDQLIQLL